MSTFQTKFRLIEAEQFFPDKPLPFHRQGPYVAFTPERDFHVTTAHGDTITLQPGMWVVKEPSGPHTISFAAYPVRDDIFAMNYELQAASAPLLGRTPIQEIDRLINHAFTKGKAVGFRQALREASLQAWASQETIAEVAQLFWDGLAPTRPVRTPDQPDQERSDVICEGCDKDLTEAKRHVTLDDVYLCEECWDEFVREDRSQYGNARDRDRAAKEGRYAANCINDHLASMAATYARRAAHYANRFLGPYVDPLP